MLQRCVFFKIATATPGIYTWHRIGELNGIVGWDVRLLVGRFVQND